MPNSLAYVSSKKSLAYIRMNAAVINRDVDVIPGILCE